MRWRRSVPTRSAAPSRFSRRWTGRSSPPGISSLVVAPEGSQVAGRLIATAHAAGAYHRRRARARSSGGSARRSNKRSPSSRIDLIHAHGLDFAEHLPETNVPTLITLHLPAEFYPTGGSRRAPEHLVPLRVGGPAAALSAAARTCSTRYRTACRSIASGRATPGAISPWRSGASARKKAFIWRSTRLGSPGRRC